MCMNFDRIAVLVKNRIFVLFISDRKMDLKLFMTKSKDGGLMWCGTSGKVKLKGLN